MQQQLSQWQVRIFILFIYEIYIICDKLEKSRWLHLLITLIVYLLFLLRKMIEGR